MNNNLAINGGPKVFDKTSDAKFIWPRITKEAEEAVRTQLYESISIYDKSGIIKDFEDQFSKYHHKDYSLLSNSGTSAIFSMYEGLGLKPGDEVLCPVYTFHATVSPVIYTGATPVFCDADEEGNISLKSVERNYSNKTRAVIVTHMWGNPVKDVIAIKKFCDYKNIFLLEDCSHAHGAMCNGGLVGTFGHASSWSLQGQKIITGGEGGIMLTDDAGIFNRALLQGHYNKRPLKEIDEENSIKKYFLTGFGLKLRAHPLAIALALQQFRHLDEFLEVKQNFAEKFNKAFKDYPFLITPNAKLANGRNSWYAYILLFDSKKSYGVSREKFVEALCAEGLVEVDIPGSTCPLNKLPLFTDPHLIMPRLYSAPIKQDCDYSSAYRFYNSIIKLPVWAFKDEEYIVDKYIEGVRKVSDYLRKHKSLK